MGTIKLHYEMDVALFKSAVAFPQIVRAEGTTGPVPGLAFDTTTEETCFFRFRAINYGASNPSITLLVGWYAATASSGGIAIGASLAAQTPNTDTGDTEAKAFATETIFTDTHLGTVGKRPHDALGSITTNLDSVATDDWVLLRIARKTADAGDTMTGDMIMTSLDVSYSDT